MSNNKALTPEEIQKKIQVTGTGSNNNVPQNAINLKQNQNNNLNKPIPEPISNNTNQNGQHGSTQNGNVIVTKDEKGNQSIQQVQGDIAAEIAAGRGQIVQGQAAEASQSPEKAQAIKLLDFGSVENQDAARRLDYYLNLANPIFKVVENEIVSRDASGNEIKKTVSQRVLQGYEYYDVDGVPLKQWIIDTFGPEYKLNVNNNTVEKISNN